MAQAAMQEIETSKSNIFARISKRRAQARSIARKGALAYVGLYVAGYEHVKPYFVKTDQWIDELAEKGEVVEFATQQFVKDTAGKAGNLMNFKKASPS